MANNSVFSVPTDALRPYARVRGIRRRRATRRRSRRAASRAPARRAARTTRPTRSAAMFARSLRARAPMWQRRAPGPPTYTATSPASERPARRGAE